MDVNVLLCPALAAERSAIGYACAIGVTRLAQTPQYKRPTAHGSGSCTEGARGRRESGLRYLRVARLRDTRGGRSAACGGGVACRWLLRLIRGCVLHGPHPPMYAAYARRPMHSVYPLNQGRYRGHNVTAVVYARVP